MSIHMRWIKSFVAMSQRRQNSYTGWPFDRPHCGIILLSNAAIFTLHILRSVAGWFTPVEQVPELQQIVHAKGGPASRDAMEGVCRHHVRHIGQQGLQLPVRVVIEDPILTPGELPRHQLVLGTTKRVKRMADAESACGGPRTTCSR
jgi:hypothetical protein